MNRSLLVPIIFTPDTESSTSHSKCPFSRALEVCGVREEFSVCEQERARRAARTLCRGESSLVDKGSGVAPIGGCKHWAGYVGIDVREAAPDLTAEL